MSGREEKPKLSVPKFSSFKPEPSESPAPETKDKESQSENKEKKRHRHSRHDDERSKRRRQESRQGEERHKESRHRREAERDSTRHSRDRDERRRAAESSTSRPTPQSANPVTQVKSDHFFVDVKGDPLIIKYGGLDRYRIPVYRRYGYGRVLGTPGRLIIHRDEARDQFSLVMPGEGSAAFKDKDGLRSRSSRARRNPVLLRARKGVDAEADEDGYLAIGSLKEGRRASQSDGSDAETKPDYRSIEGKAKAREVLDSESELEESGGEDELPPLDQSNPLKWRSIQLSRRVKDHPEDTAAWIELVDHQDALLKAGQDPDSQVLENEAHSYAEIKVSMLESALSHTSDPKDRLRVLNYLMREGIKVWNAKTAMKKWSEALKEDGDSFDLWKLYLDFSMSDIASFKFEDIKSMILDRMHRVIAAPESEKSHAYGQATYLFLRATKLIHDSGYRELAVAAWQAMLEMTFFRPSGLSSLTAATEVFEIFWESEVPRIGEPEALGWKQFVASPGEAPEPTEASRPQAGATKDPYRAWGDEEQWQAARARLPARTLDQGNDDDPFRVVMFSDIAPFLFYIPDDILPQLGTGLLNAFLVFSRLPPLPSVDEWTARAMQDPFITEPWDRLPNHRHEDETLNSPHVKRLPNFAPAMMRAVVSPELLFSAEGWYHAMPRPGPLHPPRLEMANNALGKLAQNNGSQMDVALYYLALNSLLEPTNLKKLAKSLLKQYPTSISLYNGYALAEHARQNDDIARKVLASATELASVSLHCHPLCTTMNKS